RWLARKWCIHSHIKKRTGNPHMLTSYNKPTITWQESGGKPMGWFNCTQATNLGRGRQKSNKRMQVIGEYRPMPQFAIGIGMGQTHHEDRILQTNTKRSYQSSQLCQGKA